MIIALTDGRPSVELDRRERILLYLAQQPMPVAKYDSRGYRRTIEAISGETQIPISSTYKVLQELERERLAAKMSERYIGRVRVPGRYVTRTSMYVLTHHGELVAADIRRRSA